MPTITVQGEVPFEAAPGTKLVLAIEDAGIDILHRCGGFARCTTCRVKFQEGEPEAVGKTERATLEEDGFLGTFRLACQVKVGEEDMSVQVACRAHANGVPPGPRPDDK